MSETVSNSGLQATMALGGRMLETGSVSVSEPVNRALVSVAFAASDRERIGAAFGSPLPAVGLSQSSSHAGTVLGLQIDQVWCLLEHTGDAMDKTIAATLGDTRGMYLTDQSDAWAILALSGSASIHVLERLCPLDLELAVFPVGSVARTVMEHVGVIILRTHNDRFELITPRSSSTSFMHAIETVATHVHNEHDILSNNNA